MGFYLRQVVRGRSTPNPATWLIWLVIGLINATTYFLVVEGNLLRSLSLILVNLGILVITLYSFFRGKFSPIGATELSCLSMGLAVGVLWQVTGNPILANLTLQVVYLISFVPTILGLHRGRLYERPWPWVLAVGTYVFMILAVVASWRRDSWVALAHPVLNGLLGNGLVAFYAFRGQWIRARSLRLDEIANTFNGL